MRSVFIDAVGSGSSLGTATGFLVSPVPSAAPYLVTNYHVASGRHPANGQPLHQSGAVPDGLRLQLPRREPPDRVAWFQHEVQVLTSDTDGREVANWLEHPTLGREVDVVAIRLDGIVVDEMFLYDLDDSSPRLRVVPTSDLSIVGFPSDSGQPAREPLRSGLEASSRPIRTLTLTSYRGS